MSEVLPLTTIGIIIVIAIGISIIIKKMGQNPVLGFILAGFILGPFGLAFLDPTHELVNAFSELGLFVLLFYLGLELSLKDFLKAGSSSIGLALIDMIGLAGIGFIVMQLLGYSVMFSVVVGFMLFCTSTAIVAKFILDKDLIKNPAAQLSLSILILQDFLGILLLVFLTSFSGQGDPIGLSLNAIVFAVSAFVVVYQLSKFMENWLTENKFSHTEITLYALGVGLIVSTVANYLGLSIALGAYFAGFALAETRAGNSIKKDVGFMRDFFLLFFFVAFGTTIFFNAEATVQVLPEIGVILYLLGISLLLALGIIVVNILTFGLFGEMFGLKKEDASVTGILLTPLGEFVVIIATTSAGVLTVAEKTLMGPLAFMIILITVVIFTPLYNFLPIHRKISLMIPSLFKRDLNKTVVHETSSIEKEIIKGIALNLFIVLCLAWMTWILYYELPRFGLPILYSRQATALITFLIFAAIPLNNAFKNTKKLFKELDKKLHEKGLSLGEMHH
ncbi:MAG: cation:proton antiporter [Candidatus Diapherotrites archaeon]|nr:cation:proton antiporter [Candidatus Diapherotrites archaeon]